MSADLRVDEESATDGCMGCIGMFVLCLLLVIATIAVVWS